VVTRQGWEVVDLTIINQNVEKHRDGEGYQALVLQVVDNGGEMVSLKHPRTIHVCICARVSDQSHYMNLQALF
jgi:hypothetical protein